MLRERPVRRESVRAARLGTEPVNNGFLSGWGDLIDHSNIAAIAALARRSVKIAIAAKQQTRHRISSIKRLGGEVEVVQNRVRGAGGVYFVDSPLVAGPALFSRSIKVSVIALDQDPDRVCPVAVCVSAEAVQHSDRTRGREFVHNPEIMRTAKQSGAVEVAICPQGGQIRRSTVTVGKVMENVELSQRRNFEERPVLPVILLFRDAVQIPILSLENSKGWRAVIRLVHEGIKRR